MADIVLEVHVCDQRRSYKATFATEDQALAFIAPRGMTHAISEWDPENPTVTKENAPRLFDRLYPTCVHGMSAWLCADPINHYPSDAQMAGGY